MKILVAGGRGFVGDPVCMALRKHSVYTFDRGSGGKNHRQGSIASKKDLEKAAKGMDMVINLVGLSPLKKPKVPYEKIHAEGVKNIIEACRKQGVNRIIQMSNLGADPKAKTEMLRTKGRAEKLLLESGLDVTIIRPSIIYDAENELVRTAYRLAWTRMFPDIPAKVQPIYRQDVGEIFRLAVERKLPRIVDAAGPDVMSVYELARKIYHSKGYACFPIPISLVRSVMGFASLFNLFGVSRDQIISLHTDNVTSHNEAAKHIDLMPFDRWLDA